MKKILKKYFSIWGRPAILITMWKNRAENCLKRGEVSPLLRIFHRILPLAAAICLLSGCGHIAGASTEEPVFVDAVSPGVVSLEEEAVALAGAPAPSDTLLEPEAPGVLTKENQKAVIDYSNTEDGYVMVRYSAATSKRLKAQVKGPNTTYTYNLSVGEWETFPLSDGNGSYQVVVYENISGTKYATVLSIRFNVTLTDEFAPFLRPNQYVDYGVAPNTVAKARELTENLTEPLKKVQAVYDFVVNNITYDYQLA